MIREQAVLERTRASADGSWLLEMSWRDVCFAHWRADGEYLQRLLPPGVVLDRYAGQAWLSVVPFRLMDLRVRGLPTLPGFEDVPEINLRTYVRVDDEPGIWFFSLDAAGPLVVRSARALTGLPYFDARITTHEGIAGISYFSARTGSRALPGQFAARYFAPATERVAAPDSIEEFLHERYRFFSLRGRRLMTGSIAHEPWSVGPTTLEISRNTLGGLIGHPLYDTPDLAYFSRGVNARAGKIRRVSSR